MTELCQRVYDRESRQSGMHTKCHLTSILPLTTETSDNNGVNRTVVEYRVYQEASAFLALEHLNRRDGSILPELPELMKHCDIEFSYEFRDSRFKEIAAAREFLTTFEDNTTSTKKPFAILGAARSAVSKTLGTLTSTFDIPQISGSSNSQELDDKGRYPYFVRTITSNTNDARACAHYLKSLDVTHFGMIYVQDDFGTDYAIALAEEARLLGMTPLAVGFQTEAEIDVAVQELAESDYRYFVGILNPVTWREVLTRAEREGIIGVPTHAWIFSDSSVEFTSSGFAVKEPELARAIHGSGVLLMHTEENILFDNALQFFSKNTTQQQQFISSHAEPDLLHSFEFEKKSPGYNQLYYQLTYDAVIALGLAACETQRNTFAVSGREVLISLKNEKFNGVSGQVTFDSHTGSRRVEGLSYRVQNVQLLPSVGKNETSWYSFESKASAIIKIPNVDILNPFIYPDNTTIPPDAIPTLDHNMNLIPEGIRIVGLTLCGITILLSIATIVWAWVNRKKDVIASSQPFFLIMLSIGTLISALTIIPTSLQEPLDQRTLDVACMATPWLMSIGFVTSFSALTSKAVRLHLLYQSGMRFRRIEIKPKDVLKPFIGLMLLNLSFLIAWTIVSPLKWERRNISSFDRFGRSIESHGECHSSNPNAISDTIFTIPLVVVNVFAALLATYHSFITRNIPTAYHESFYVAVSLASMSETFLLGVPIFLLVYGSPGARYLVGALGISIMCLAVLFLIFYPKFRRRQMINTFMTRAETISSTIDNRGDSTKSTTSKSDVFLQDLSLHTSNHSRTTDTLRMKRESTTKPGEREIGKIRVNRRRSYYLERGIPLPIQARVPKISGLNFNLKGLSIRRMSMKRMSLKSIAKQISSSRDSMMSRTSTSRQDYGVKEDIFGDCLNSSTAGDNV